MTNLRGSSERCVTAPMDSCRSQGLDQTPEPCRVRGSYGSQKPGDRLMEEASRGFEPLVAAIPDSRVEILALLKSVDG